MNKAGLLRVVNIILFFSFILQAITSIIILLRIKVPNAQMVFEIHEYNGLFMITVVIMHLILNWGWVKANFFKKLKY